MIASLMQSRLARWGFVVVAVVLSVVALSRYWSEVRAAAADLRTVPVLASAVLALLGTACTLLAWRRVLTDLGSPLPLGAAARVFSLAQLGKYIPGSVWPFLAQVELGREHGVPRRRSAAVSVLVVAISLVTALLVASVTLPFVAQDAARAYWWVLAAAPALAALLHPVVLNPLLDRALAVARRPPLETRLSLRGILAAVSWSAAAWISYGLHVWVLAVDLGATGATLPLACIGLFALAWSAGFVFVIAPAGAGVREVVLAAGLGQVIGLGRVVLLVIASRLLVTLGDLLWAGAGYLLGRRHAAATDSADRLAEAISLRESRARTSEAGPG